MKVKFPRYLVHDHHPKSIQERLKKTSKKSFLRDFVYGAIDGSVTTFAIVAGVKGADLSTATILILGASNVLADGFSMAAGNYLGIKSEQDEKKVISEFEKNQILNDPDGEKAEIREIYRAKGFMDEHLEKTVELLTKNKELWLKIMLHEEYGLDQQEGSALKAGLITFVAFLLFGLIPLIPYVFKVEEAFFFATILTGLSFFLLGTFKSFWSLESFWLSGIKTLILGALAASIAYYVGDFLAKILT